MKRFRVGVVKDVRVRPAPPLKLKYSPSEDDGNDTPSDSIAKAALAGGGSGCELQAAMVQNFKERALEADNLRNFVPSCTTPNFRRKPINTLTGVRCFLKQVVINDHFFPFNAIG
jgi:hypothetical protein